MPLRFSANLSFMFTGETDDLATRYKLAREAGFSAVECANPYECPLEELVAAQEAANLQQVLINTWDGGLENGNYGIGALPGKEQVFKEKLEITIKYATALKCPRVRIFAAKQPAEVSAEVMEAVYVSNLKYAADRLKQVNIVGMVEPCNSYSMPGYLVNSVDKALRIIQAVDHPNIRLQMDFFHLQQMGGNLTRCIDMYLPLVEHIQVAQVPHRHEVHSEGEVNYRYIFRYLNEKGYSGWVGLEYKPMCTTLEGLDWVKEWGYVL